MISLIWAEDEAGAIGKDNQLPWELPNDMKFFRETTTNHTVVMGRKTFESMNSRPLPNRRNFVMTRQKYYKAPGAIVIHELLDLAKRVDVHENIYIIGGSEIYRHFLPVADVLLRTKISGDFKGNTFFPTVKWSEWELVKETPGITDEKNKYEHVFQTFKRK